MELSPLTEAIRADLAVAAELGDDAVRDAADRLSRALEAALRVRLLDALGQAAHELSSQLEAGSVDLRLAGDSVELVLAMEGAEPASPAPPPADDAETARITLRLPEALKARAEQAAAKEGMSTNAWLARAVASALERRPPAAPRVGQRLRGFAEG